MMWYSALTLIINHTDLVGDEVSRDELLPILRFGQDRPVAILVSSSILQTSRTTIDHGGLVSTLKDNCPSSFVVPRPGG